MSGNLRELLAKYKYKNLLIDTNILLVYLVGNIDASYIAKFKRTSDYTIDDYEKIKLFISPFRKIITFPHLLTEVSNLAKNIDEQHKEDFTSEFKKFVEFTKEHFVASKEILSQNELKLFSKYGLADLSIIDYLVKESNKSILFFTNDELLFRYVCYNLGIDAIKYSYFF